MSTRIEGLDELIADWHRECATLTTNLGRGAMKAAGEGVAEAKANHPYTDRTGDLTASSHVNPLSGGDAEMVWPMPYAGYVDEGTSRSRPYPYTPGAVKVAGEALDANSDKAAQAICDAMTSKYG